MSTLTALVTAVTGILPLPDQATSSEAAPARAAHLEASRFPPKLLLRNDLHCTAVSRKCKNLLTSQANYR